MRAILFGASGVLGRDSAELQVHPRDFLVGIDGGVLLAQKAGFRVDFAVGDWDSLPKSQRSVLTRIPHVSLNRDKERSDLFYALAAAIQAGAREIVCLGVTGGRPDHHLASLYDLSIFSSGRYGRLRKIQAMGEEGDYHFLSEVIPLWTGQLKRKTLVSVFALDGPVEGLNLSGFKFTLKNAVLTSSSQGLSNWVCGRRCQVQLKKGKAVVILPRSFQNV